MGLATLTAHVAGTVLTAAALNNNFNAIVNQLNGNIEAANLANLAVTAAKLATGAVTGPKIAMGSDAQGDTLIRGASSYERLAAGTSGQIFKTNGAGANPAWASYTSLFLTPKEYTTVEDTTTADESTTSSSYQDTALSLTFTVGKDGIVSASFDAVGLSDSGTGYWAILVDGVEKKTIAYTAGSGGPTAIPLSLFWHGVLAAGSHTIKIQIKNDGGGGATSIKGVTSTARLNVSHPS